MFHFLSNRVLFHHWAVQAYTSSVYCSVGGWLYPFRDPLRRASQWSTNRKRMCEGLNTYAECRRKFVVDDYYQNTSPPSSCEPRLLVALAWLGSINIYIIHDHICWS
jgi:hypothetical protein